MKIIVFTDVHGGLNSLLALEKTEDFKTSDKKIFLGDITFGCSRPIECVQFLVDNNCDCILGNNDVYISDHIPDVDREQFSDNKFQQYLWMNKTITSHTKNILKTWKKQLTLEIYGKKFLFTHYPWENYNNDTNVIDIPDELSFQSRANMFGDIDADYYIFGHEHKTTYFHNEFKHFFCLNTLSLESPGSYLVIEVDDKQTKLTEKFVSFDIEEEKFLIEKAGYPFKKT